ncbi:MAG: ABC transporter permease [Gammaproteobacteria bacterium]|nr:ABC transporter permease [Gammaproteobacteria bacterium]
MIADTWHLYNKYLIISLRMPLWSLFSLIQPLLWLFIFTALFSNFAQLPGFPGDTYLDYFLPGVLMMTVLFGSSWSGVSLLREINSGTVDKLLVSPISRASIVLSRVLHSASQVVAQALIVLAVAWMLGANFSWHPLNLFLILSIMLLLGIAFACLSNGFAILSQREEPLVIMGNMMTLPLMFFSSAMVPEAFMPEWIQTAALVNPVEYGVDALRAVLTKEINTELFLQGFFVTLAITLAALFWAISAFKGLRD